MDNLDNKEIKGRLIEYLREKIPDYIESHHGQLFILSLSGDNFEVKFCNTRSELDLSTKELFPNGNRDFIRGYVPSDEREYNPKRSIREIIIDE